MSAPLDGIRVLELATGIAGSVAGMLLCDFGAEVVKVEPSGGDPARALPGFAVWNRGKRSVRGDVGPLLGGADVVLSNDAVSAPGAVVLRLTPYTDTAPWAGGAESAPLLAAACGIAFRQSSWEDVPVDSIYPHVLYAQGLWAATCAVAALVERARTACVRSATVAGVHGALVASCGNLVIDPRLEIGFRPGGSGGPAPFYRPYRCADGEWLFLAALTPTFYMRAFELLGVMNIFADERLGGEPSMMLAVRNIPWVLERIASVFATRPRGEWLRLLAEAAVPAGPLLERDDWLDHPQVRAIGMRVEVDDPERGRVVMPGVHVRLTESPGSVRGPAPPLRSDEVPAWPASGPSSVAGEARGPLAGVRVLDLGAIIAGPYACTLLGRLGADVVKVEPVTGESFRSASGGFAAYNVGQRSVAIDLRDAAGRDAFLALVRDADVVVDNYRPGVLERRRITYDDLRAVNPRIVTLSITGFGEGGPLSGDPGFDPVLQAMSGMMRAQGGDDDPVFFTMPVNDIGSATSAAFGIALALLHRERTGRGQRVWTSLAGTAAFMQSGELVRFEGRIPAVRGGRDFPGPTPEDRLLPAKDGWLRVQGPCEADEVASLGRDDAVLMLTIRGVPAAPARRPAELPSTDELASYGYLRPVGDDVYMAGRFVVFDPPSTPDETPVAPLGAQTRALLGAAGVDVDALLARGVVAE